MLLLQRGEIALRQFIADGTVPSPADVAAQEVFFGKFGAAVVFGPRPLSTVPLLVSGRARVDAIDTSQLVDERRTYYLGIGSDGVHLLFNVQATWRDVLCGFFSATKLQLILESHGVGALPQPLSPRALCAIDEAERYAVSSLDGVVTLLQAQGWWVTQPTIEHDAGSTRVTVSAE